MSQSTTLDFSASDISPFGLSTSGLVFSVPSSWWQTRSLGPISNKAYELSGTLTGGIEGGLGLSLGNIGFNYPINLNTNYNSYVNDGLSFDIDTSNFVVSGETLDVLGPSASAELHFGIGGSFDGYFAGFYAIHGDFGFNTDVSPQLEFSSKAGSVTVSLPGNMTYSDLEVSAGTLPNLTKDGQSNNAIVSAAVDLAQLAEGNRSHPPLFSAIA